MAAHPAEPNHPAKSLYRASMTERAGNLLVLVGALVILSVGMAGCGTEGSRPAARQPDTTQTTQPPIAALTEPVESPIPSSHSTSAQSASSATSPAPSAAPVVRPTANPPLPSTPFPTPMSIPHPTPQPTTNPIDPSRQTSRFQSISAGHNHVCALRTNGFVTCWGDNSHGQLEVPNALFHSVFAGDKQTGSSR